MPLKPIDLPSAAGQNFGEGDVRHFSEGDSMSVPDLSAPTRQLAQRDNDLAAKLNEVVDVVNNKEQFVPLPMLRTTLSPTDEIIATNYRIPPGFEARVLNATIAAAPISADIQLDILYAQGYGNTSGESIVSTSDEFTAGTSFFQNGEFIVILRNKSGITLDLIPSILLTMRPVGEAGTLLVGSIIQGQRGPVGMTGGQGRQGEPGTGGAGSPGMIWDGAWVTAKNYNPKTVVSFPLYGTVTSSYFCKVAHLSDPTNEPPNATFWDIVALGSAGSTAQGPAGPAGPAGNQVTFATSSLFGTAVPDGDYVGGATDNGYVGGGAAYGTTSLGFSEFTIDGTATPIRGMTFLQATFRRAFQGNVKVFLPQIGWNGAKIDWTNVLVTCNASINGSYAAVYPVAGVDTVQVSSPSATRYDVRVKATTPQKVSITFVGLASF
jgi:hypothetical protein